MPNKEKIPMTRRAAIAFFFIVRVFFQFFFLLLLLVCKLLFFALWTVELVADDTLASATFTFLYNSFVLLVVSVVVVNFCAASFTCRFALSLVVVVVAVVMVVVVIVDVAFITTFADVKICTSQCRMPHS